MAAHIRIVAFRVRVRRCGGLASRQAVRTPRSFRLRGMLTATGAMFTVAECSRWPVGAVVWRRRPLEGRRSDSLDGSRRGSDGFVLSGVIAREFAATPRNRRAPERGGGGAVAPRPRCVS